MSTPTAHGSGHRDRIQVRITVDLVIFTVRNGALQVLLIERGNDPFKGKYALPGGFLRPGEDLQTAAGRELVEETKIDARSNHLHLEEFGTYSDPDRDPRYRVISVGYLAIAPDLPTPVPGTDARGAQWTPVSDLDATVLAFDHGRIVADALERARAKLETTTLATKFCGEEFTLTELHQVYEVVWGIPVDPRNFRRKVTKTEGFIVPTGTQRRPKVGRPAALYQAGGANTLYPAMLRRHAQSE